METRGCCCNNNSSNKSNKQDDIKIHFQLRILGAFFPLFINALTNVQEIEHF